MPLQIVMPRERDSVSLFIGNLPQDVTQDELRALSSDITDVFMPHPFRRCAFLRFASEEKADTNYKTLQGKELNGSRLKVDYQGAKMFITNHLLLPPNLLLQGLFGTGALYRNLTNQELERKTAHIQDFNLYQQVRDNIRQLKPVASALAYLESDSATVADAFQCMVRFVVP
ncbi:hypothetical protein TNCV_2036041 [Trichonephila clavipes]|nr:hypothetical protein TNCV_2036041 [Trichonephila clavipes]